MNDALNPGGFSEETMIRHAEDYSFLSPIPDTLDYITAALLEPTNCCRRVAMQTGLVPGESVLIFGMGPIGIITGLILQTLGAGKIIGVDNSPKRISKVRALGFFEVLDSSRPDWKNQLLEMSGPDGVDVVVEATGAVSVLQSSFELVRRGGRIVITSVYHGPADGLELKDIMRKELTIRGAKGPFPATTVGGNSLALELLVKLQDKLNRIITVYEYKDAIKAFDHMMSGEAIKAIVKF